MDIKFGSMIFQLLAFIVLFILLKKYAFGPLLGVMEKRQKQIDDQIKSAETNRQEADRLLKEQNDELQKSRIEAHQLIENAKASSEKQALDILDNAKVEAERIKNQALQDINLEKEKAVAELREQVGALSVLIAAKMIEKEIDEKTQSKLIDDIMKQVGEGL